MSGHELLEGGINWFEVFHLAFAGVALAALIAGVITVWDIIGGPTDEG